jgi:hypothetical protein
VANPWKAEAVEAINAHLRDHGPSGWERVESKFPNVPKATLWRWIKEVREKASDSPSRQKLQAAKAKIKKIVEEVHSVGGSLPAAPSPAYLAAKGAEGEASINVLGRINELYKEAEQLRDYALNDVGKIRIPIFYKESINLRRNILQTKIDMLQEVYDLRRMEAFYEAIMDEIGKVSPEVQRAIVDRMRRIDRERGITINC